MTSEVKLLFQRRVKAGPGLGRRLSGRQGGGASSHPDAGRHPPRSPHPQPPSAGTGAAHPGSALDRGPAGLQLQLPYSFEFLLRFSPTEMFIF